MATEGERNRGAGAYSTPGVDHKPDLSPAKIITSSPIVSFKFAGVDPPSSVYITREDVLRMFMVTLNAIGDTVTFTLRILTVQGLVIPNVFTLTTNAGPVQVSQTKELTEGFLLSISAVAAQAQERGITFVRANLFRGGVAGSNHVATLISDYVTQNSFPTGPGGRIVYPTEGPGNMRRALPTAPGAGQDWNINVSASARWRIQSIFATLTTSAAVANRLPRIRISQNASVVWESPNPTPQAASLALDYVATGGATYQNDGTLTVLQTLPAGVYAAPGNLIQSVTTGIQAADQWSNVALHVEEWVDAI